MSGDSTRFGLKKEACRKGLSDDARRHAWFCLGTETAVAGSLPNRSPATPQQLEYYLAALREVFGNVDPVPSKIFRIPFLGVEPSVLAEEATVLLSQPSIAVSAAHDRVICVLAQLHSLRYCPQVPNIALILLNFCSEAETFTIIERMLKTNKLTNALTLSKKEETAFVKTFRTLIKSYYPHVSEHLEAFGSPIRAVFASWFRGFFTGWLPPTDVYRVMDAYFYEGPKILLRFGLAILKLAKKKLGSVSSASEFDRLVRRWVASSVISRMRSEGSIAALSFPLPSSLLRDSPVSLDLFSEPYSFSSLAATAYGISGLSRSTIQGLMEKYMGSGAAVGEMGSPRLDAPKSADVASDGSSTITIASRNSILTVGRSGHDLGKDSSAALLAAASSEHEHVTSAGVAYDTVGMTGDDKGAPPVWYNPKIVGLGCRLMTLDFSPLSGKALRQRVKHAYARAPDQLFQPEGTRTGVKSTVASHVTMSGDGGDGSEERIMRENNATWLSGVMGGKPPAAHANVLEVFGVRGDKHALPTLTPTDADGPLSPPASTPTADVLAVAYSVASSPHLASLSTLLPDRVSTHNWTCLYSTDLHGWSLATMYARCAGIGPLVVMIQAGVKSSVMVPETPRVTTSTATASKLATALSSRRPVFGFYTGGGLKGGTGPTVGWQGTSQDFMFQLFPELNVFPASNAEKLVHTGTDVKLEASTSAADLATTGHRTLLYKDKFILCTEDYLCVGGSPVKAGTQALLLHSTLEKGLASIAFLQDMSIPEARHAGMEKEIPIDIYSVEVYAFLDRCGSFMSTDAAAAAQAKLRYRAALEKYWVTVPETERF